MLETIPSNFYRTTIAPGTFLTFKNLKMPSQKPRNPADGTGQLMDIDDDETDNVKASNPKRHPDTGLTAFLRMGDPIPLGHVQGEYPPRWKGARVSYRGIQMIAQMKHLFEVIPSMSLQSIVRIFIE